MGVGIIAVGGVLAIYARLAQSSSQHKNLIEKLDALNDLIVGESINEAKATDPVATNLNPDLNELRKMVADKEKKPASPSLSNQEYRKMYDERAKNEDSLFE